MAIVDSREIFRGKSLQMQFGDVPVHTRVFLVRTNSLDDKLEDISNAPNIAWLAPHPENEEALMIDCGVQPEDESPFHWRVTFTYKTAVDLVTTPLDRPDQFSFSGSLASAPCFWYYPNDSDNNTKKIIINTAGDPIGGLDKDEGEFVVTITGNRPDPFPYSIATQYVGAINSDTWGGGGPKTWKCQTITANRKIEQIAGAKYVYWEVNTSLAYRATGWDLQTWDVGFNQIVNGERRKIKDANQEPVSEPAALSGGTAKAPGQAPDLLTFRIYKMLPFTGAFPALPG